MKRKVVAIILAAALEYQANHPVAVTAGLSVSGGFGPIGLPISMYVDGTYAGQAVTSAQGFFVFSYPGMSVGIHTLAASFAGNAQYGPSTSMPYRISVVDVLPQ